LKTDFLVRGALSAREFGNGEADSLRAANDNHALSIE
jgi:hypothetical protein